MKHSFDSDALPELRMHRFMLHWIFEHVMAWVWLVIAWVFGGTLLTGLLYTVSGNLLGAAMLLGLLPGLLMGALLGLSQKRVLRTHMLWTADRWVPYSVLGSTLGWTLIFLSGIAADPRMSLGIMVACLSSAQWLSLRQAVRDAWLWPLTYLAGALGSFSLMDQMSMITTSGTEILLRAGLAFLMPAIISGLVIAYLFKKRSYPYDLSAYLRLQTNERKQVEPEETDFQRLKNEASSASASASERR